MHFKYFVPIEVKLFCYYEIIILFQTPSQGKSRLFFAKLWYTTELQEIVYKLFLYNNLPLFHTFCFYMDCNYSFNYFSLYQSLLPFIVYPCCTFSVFVMITRILWFLSCMICILSYKIYNIL